ncbi:VOC family protein [Citricoccus sp. NR2]|uniref:VOC family protein n=1 Tax=Citricoccus sp. NR2 TaxID=3004095 RepID=UPI0022DDE2AA|nr:VOC family protein [Citricoccus sp. NR2]WBL19327.1 VOC family protein [Citricoccus sp. NR2]
MKLRWYSIVIDCHDVAAQARWWADVLDWRLIFEAGDEAVIIPKDMPADLDMEEPVPVHRWHHVPPGLVFVPVPEGKTVKNRLHIDLAPHLQDDRDAQIQRLIDAGARRVDVGQDASEVTWTVLADPEGNEFCVLSSRDR